MDAKRIKIGPYTIIDLLDGSFWIQHENGEAMEAATEDMVKMLEKFWEDKF